MLSSILMESATLIGTPKVSEEMLAKYGYNSEHRIAMESAVELNDIFYESFYKMEELDFQRAYATMEGADESVLEGIGSSISERAKGAIEKIKTFLRDLWEKVKAFFHNVKRFLDGIFMNAQDFVKKYESELLKLTFKDKPYTVDMYDYNISDCKAMATTVNKYCGTLTSEGAKAMSTATKLGNFFGAQAIRASVGSGEDNVKKFPDDNSAGKSKDAARKKVDEACEKLLKDTLGPIRDDLGKYLKTAKDDVPTTAEVAEATWRIIRKGASSDSDKKSVTVTSLSEYVKYLKTSKDALSGFDKTAKAIDNMYKEVLARISDAEKKINEESDELFKELTLKVSSTYSKVVSREQGFTNAIVAENRKALQEKIAVYKKICTSAFAHADKGSKK